MISNQVIKTKLYSPPARSNLVARPRLVERMNAGLQMDHKLILVSAAAGFGKTTLAGEWIAAGRLSPSVAWISLDAEDNDPARFLFYLITALEQVDPEIGRSILPVLQSTQSAPLNELAAQLINQIAAAEKTVILILDDYHLITADGVHQMAQLLVERQPELMHTVILTREDPPLPLPRMRARGQVTEVRERELRFTLPEAQAFLVEAMGLCLSVDEVGKLKDRTEGWVAGMQLAALALEDYDAEHGRRAFIDAFTGSDRFIVDYLVSEVLERQPGEAREFLLASSVLDRFCGDLCDHVVYGAEGAGKSQQILDSLEQENMFLVPLDNQRLWYRFHHLFAEMLLHFLSRSNPERVPELRRRASEWFGARGSAAEAVRYALATQDWNFIAALLDQHAMRLLLQGQSNLVLGWCHAFPKPILETLPTVCIYYAWALVLTFRQDYLDAVEEKLQLAEWAIADEDLPTFAPVGSNGSAVPLRNWVAGQVCVLRSQILLGRFHTYVDPQELIALSLKGLELLPEVERGIRATCRINLAHAQLIQNNPVEAQKLFDEAQPYHLAAENYLGGVTCIFYQARLAYYMGDLERADTLWRHWKERFLELSGKTERDIPAIRGLDIIQSILLMERGQLDTAEKVLVGVLELPGWASWMELFGFIALARLRYLRGDRAGADETLRRMAGMGPQHAACSEALQILFDFNNAPDDANLRAKAEHWAKSAGPDWRAPLALGIGPYHCDVEYFCNLAWAQIQLSLGYPSEALRFARAALGSAEEHHLTFRILELTILRALAYEKLGDPEAAFADVQKALDIAEAHGYMRVFIETPSLGRLLRRAAERNGTSKFAKQLIAALGSPAGAQIAQAGSEVSQPLIEPLSEREAEVLRLIAGGLSNNQICERLYIAQGTVKRHITNLYGKLEVQSRTQAIVRARELGLLS